MITWKAMNKSSAWDDTGRMTIGCCTMMPKRGNRAISPISQAYVCALHCNVDADSTFITHLITCGGFLDFKENGITKMKHWAVILRKDLKMLISVPLGFRREDYKLRMCRWYLKCAYSRSSSWQAAQLLLNATHADVTYTRQLIRRYSWGT